MSFVAGRPRVRVRLSGDGVGASEGELEEFAHGRKVLFTWSQWQAYDDLVKFDFITCWLVLDHSLAVKLVNVLAECAL
jgi:hypothetical protein